MKELKFRIFINEQGNPFMHYLDLREKPDWAHPYRYLVELQGALVDGSPVMQYTGLKDKNGKEIYEGDIIEFDKIEWGGDDNIHVVSWNDKDAQWDWGGGNTSDMDYRTVIGNIYENPELLKDIK